MYSTLFMAHKLSSVQSLEPKSLFKQGYLGQFYSDAGSSNDKQNVQICYLFVGYEFAKLDYDDDESDAVMPSRS